MKGTSLPLLLTAAFVLCAGFPAAAQEAPAGTHDYSDKDVREGATLRGLAELAIGNLYSPCPGPSATAEQVRRFETLRDNGGTHADRIDLQLIHSAHNLRMSRVRVRCRPVEGNARFFEITRSSLGDHLDRIEQQIAKRPDYAEMSFTGPYTAKDAKRGAAVHEAVMITIAQISSPCGLTSKKITTLAERYSGLKQSALTHAQRIDFAVGEANHEYSMSLVDILCPEPGSENETAQLEMREAEAAASLERLEAAIASAYPSEE